MKVKHRDVAAGVLKLQLETLDDLWSLRTLVARGDLVRMDTHRTAEASADKLREGKQEKKRMRLGLRVESVEWHDFDDHVRILGLIEEGPQDLGRHHTFVVRDDPTAPVEIHKSGRLTRWQLDVVDQAVKDAAAPKVVLLAIDDSEAQFAVLRNYGVQWLGTLPASGQGKRDGGAAAAAAKAAFYDEAAKTLRTLREPGVGVIVVGPGWWREEFIDHVRGKEPALADGLLTDGTSQGGRAGVQEALRRGMVERVARDHRVQWETEKVQEVMARIAKGDGLVAYGPAEVAAAVAAGAADEVLVTDDAVRAGRFDDALAQAEATRCKVHVLASSHEAGATLARFSGIAALLRFALG